MYCTIAFMLLSRLLSNIFLTFIIIPTTYFKNSGILFILLQNTEKGKVT